VSGFYLALEVYLCDTLILPALFFAFHTSPSDSFLDHSVRAYPKPSSSSFLDCSAIVYSFCQLNCGWVGVIKVAAFVTI
jgi:hypothetical protein